MRRLLVLAVVVGALGVLAVGTASARAFFGQATMTPTGGSGVTGRAVISSPADGTRVTFLVQGLEPGTAHAAHLHTSGCAGPIVQPLNDVVARADGFGFSITSVDRSLDEILAAARAAGDGTLWANVHQFPTPVVGPGITCGQVTISTVPLP